MSGLSAVVDDSGRGTSITEPYFSVLIDNDDREPNS